MTKEEAIEMLVNATYSDEWQGNEKLTTAHLMAIEALKQVTGKLNNPDDSLLTADSEACKEQKSKLDLISRAEAIEAVCDGCAWYKTASCEEGKEEWECSEVNKIRHLPSADRPRPIDPAYVFDPESGVVPLSACEPKGPKTIIYADRPRGEWTLLTEERPVDDYEIIATVYWPGYGDSAIAVGHIDRFDNWHLYSPTEGALIKGFEVIAWKTLPEPYCGADMRGEDE